MLDKEFKDLSMGEKFQLQKLMKKKSSGIELDENESLLYEKFSGEFATAEKTAKAKWPIIIGLLVISLFAILRKCQ